MDAVEGSIDILSIASFLLIMLFTSDTDDTTNRDNSEADGMARDLNTLPWLPNRISTDIDNVTQSALSHFRIWSIAFLLDEDLGS